METGTLSKKLFSVSTSETDKVRAYWRGKRWLDEGAASGIAAAKIFILPWEDFREGVSATYPQGTADFLHELREALPADMPVAFYEPESGYSEVALHSKVWRFPVIFLSAVAVPVLVNVLSEQINNFLPDKKPDDTIELTIIAEGETGRCIQIDYSGPSEDIPESILGQVEKCLPKVDKVRD